MDHRVTSGEKESLFGLSTSSPIDRLLFNSGTCGSMPDGLFSSSSSIQDRDRRGSSLSSTDQMLSFYGMSRNNSVTHVCAPMDLIQQSSSVTRTDDNDYVTVITNGELSSGGESIFPNEQGSFFNFQFDGDEDELNNEGDKNYPPGDIVQVEPKRSVEKVVSLSVLQKYFRGSLKDAAKSLGVCPTTLKRICRKHGITRWPSRKINKVNSSLRKISKVLESVQGIGRDGLCVFEDGGLLPRSHFRLDTDGIGDLGSAGGGGTENDNVPAQSDSGHRSSSSQSRKSDGSHRVTVKVTCGDDTVRFKFAPSSGCSRLYEEVGRRFEIPTGAFQLRYLDDEQEWVVLACDADLEECVEILTNAGAATVKFLVREFPHPDR